MVAHYEKDDLLNCWTSRSDISTWTFTKDTALSEHGRGTAWAQHAVYELTLRVMSGMIILNWMLEKVHIEV